MLFNSFAFLLFFLPVSYAVFWLLRSAQARYVWLTLTGYVFYAHWDARFCILMAFSTAVSFTAALGLSAHPDGPIRKAFLVVPITVDLLLLGFFKYAGFAASSLVSVINVFGAELRVPNFNIVLPVGISFYTFHTITYIVDCYRREIKPTRNIFEFAAYVSLFSQLVAGPIVRFRQIEQDLEGLGRADQFKWFVPGVAFFVWGMVEKVVIADNLAPRVDEAMADWGSLSSAGAWLAVLGYTFQLYFDFCGYSDMAVGLGYLFGLRIPMNFNSPYKALDPSDFWRRWHISLSSCLRDYLYIPLGGNRHGEWKANRNLMITMLLGGLWHGAAWTFVAWGTYHGLLLVAYRAFRDRWDALPEVPRRLATFLAVVVGWVFFRSVSFEMAGGLLVKMFLPSGGIAYGGWGYVTLLAAAAWLGMKAPNSFDVQRVWTWRRAYGFVLAAAFGACIALMLRGESSPFLYFQF